MPWTNEGQTDVASGSVYAAASTTQINPLGKRVCFDDGREFVYSSTAVDIEAGEIASAPAPSAVVANALTAAAIGATSLTTSTAVTADVYAGGYIFITDDTGQGYTYKIESNTTTVFTLKDPLIIAVDATSDYILVPNRYSAVRLGAAGQAPVGVSVVKTTAGTDSSTQYFWLQTKGPCTVFNKTTTTIAEGLEVASGADGGTVIKTANIAKIGVSLSAIDDWHAVDLCL